MADANDQVRALDQQITAVMDTHKNVAGLVEKLARVQAALIEAGLDGVVRTAVEPARDRNDLALPHGNERTPVSVRRQRSERRFLVVRTAPHAGK